MNVLTTFKYICITDFVYREILSRNLGNLKQFNRIKITKVSICHQFGCQGDILMILCR